MMQFSLVTQSSPTLRKPLDCSMPGFPIYHQLLEIAQIHVHWVSDTIQPPHPLSPLSRAFNLSSIRVFSKLVLLIRWPKYWSFSFSLFFLFWYGKPTLKFICNFKGSQIAKKQSYKRRTKLEVSHFLVSEHTTKP